MFSEHRRSNWIDLAIVLSVAIAIRAVYLWQFSTLPDWNQLTVDNWYHHNWAISIANGNFWGDTTYFRAPLYAWALGAVYYLFGPTFLVARICGLGIGVCSVALTYLMAKRIFGQRTAIIASLMQCVYPMLVTLESELLLDPLFMLIVQTCGFALLHWSERKSNRLLFVASILLGLAAITRPTILALAPLFVWAVVRSLRPTATRSLGPILIVCIGLAIPIGVTFVRNIVVAGDPVLVASQGGINFYIGNNETSDGLHAVLPQPLGHNWRIADITYIAEKDQGRQLKPGEVSQYWFERGLDWIVHNPLKFCALTVKRIWFSIADIEIDNNRNQSALMSRLSVVRYTPIGFGVVFVLATLGAMNWWRASAPTRAMVVIVICFTLINAIFFVNSRFRLPLLPVYFILAAAWLGDLTIKWRAHLRNRIFWLVLVVGLMITFSPGYLIPAERNPQDEISKGLMSYSRGDFAGSLIHYRQAEQINSEFPDVHLDLGAAHLRLGQADSAEWHFRNEIDAHPDRPLAYANLGALKLVQHHYDSAIAYARMAIERRPYEPSGWLVLIRATAAGKEDIETLAHICHESMDATRANIDVAYECATALETAGDLGGAMESYRSASRSTEPGLEIDDRMFTQTYWTAIARDTHRRAVAQMSLGAMYGKRGDFAQAAICGSSAIAIDSTLAGAWVNLISAEIQLGNFDNARNYLTKAIRLLPGDSVIAQLVQRLSP